MINVLLVKVFVSGLNFLIIAQINRAAFHSISKTITFFKLFVGQKNPSNNYHLNIMMLTVKIHLEKEPNQIRRQAGEECTEPLQSPGRRAQQNSRIPFPVQGITSTGPTKSIYNKELSPGKEKGRL